MTGVEKLAQIAVRAGITVEELQTIFDEPVCPMYTLLSEMLENRFNYHNEDYSVDYTLRYATDNDDSLEEAITELFTAEGYDETNFYANDRSLFSNSGYDTGYCTVSWISKVTKKLETYDFQWEAM